MQITDQQLNSVPFQYANDVLNGNIVTGQYVQLAVKRFFAWIETADADGFYLDHKTAMFAIDFFPRYLQHTKGPLAKTREPFELSPYQQFTIYNIFGWKNSETHLRRINFVYECVARKNGKTTLLSGLGLFCESLDGESGPEIYVGATKEAQAKTLWEQAYSFVDKSIRLRTLGFRNTQREIRFSHTSGVFRFLGGDSKTLDGLNPSVALVDEYHAHKDDSVREVLESAMGARDNPLVYIITTAGFNLKSACKMAEDSYKDILKGLNKDDHTFIMIHQMDENDDWEKEENWQKANPNLEGNPTLVDFMRREFIKCQNQANKIPNFKTKSLNMWVDGANVWIPTDLWKKCEYKDENGKLAKIPASKFASGSYAGVDLSTSTDLTAFAIISPADSDGIHYLKIFLFCPKDTITNRSKEDRVPYQFWADQGFLIPTSGNQVDYNVVEKYVRKNYFALNIQRVEFDRWNSNAITNNLSEDGLEVSNFSQTITTYSHPTKYLEKLIYEGKIRHEGNPIMEWSLSGCVRIEDHNENYRLSKKDSHANGKRIDGWIASIMALGGLLSPKEEQSRYLKPLNENEIYI